MKNKFHSGSMAFSIFCLGMAAIGLCRADNAEERDSPPLGRSSEAYWNAIVAEVRGPKAARIFPEGIPTNTDFSLWITSTTNAWARERSVSAVVSLEGTNAIPFLAWLERRTPEWRRARESAFLNISATAPYFSTNPPPRWNQDEVAVFTGFFRDRFDSETNWQCRVKMDDFLLQTDPDWKASDERLAFLERSHELCRTVATSNAILETIQDRLIPVDVEAYERHMRMIRW